MFAVLRDEQELDVVVHVLEAVQIEVRAPCVAVDGNGRTAGSYTREQRSVKHSWQ